jgi:hypothetical protein
MTHLNQLDLEIKYFMHVVPYLDAYKHLDSYTLEYLSKNGMLQVSTIVEQAVAQTGGFSVVSANTHDLSDGSDVKMASVRTSSKGKSYSASVKFKKKTGALRVITYERIHDKFYYFIIPHSEYSKASSKSTIEIPFDSDGCPKRQHLGGKFKNWWVYEVPTFTALCGPAVSVQPTNSLFDFDYDYDLVNVGELLSLDEFLETW